MNVMRSEFLPKQKRIKEQTQRNLRHFLPGFYTIPSTTAKRENLHVARPGTERFLADLKDEESDEPESETSSDILDAFKGMSTLSNSDSEDEHRKQKGEKKDDTGSTTLEFQKLLEPFYNIQGNTSLSPELDDSYMTLFYKTSPEITPCKFTQEDAGTSFKKPRIDEGCHTSGMACFNADSKHESVFLNLCDSKKQERTFHLEFGKEKTEGFHDILPTPDFKGIQRCISSPGPKTPKNRMRKSPKPSSSSKLTVSEVEAYILAVTEGRGNARGEVGLAAMDPKRPHLVLCQISDSPRYVHSLTKMSVFEFVEVLVPKTFAEGSAPSKLYSEIRSRFPTVTLTRVQRKHFSEAIGLEIIKQYCCPESASVMMLIRDKFYALSAAAALIKYIEFTQSVRLAPRSLRVDYQGTEDTMIIDLDTANALELLVCTFHPESNSKNSLLGVIKHCQTKGGVRLLKANILQPPCSLKKIQTRLDCVSELVNNPLLLCSLEAALASFTSLESLLNLCMHTPQQDGLRVAEYQLKYTLLLKTTLEQLPVLIASLEEAKSDYFIEVRESLDDVRYTMILNRILQIIFENAKTVKGSVAAHLHGCFAIKPAINNLLDVAKKTYCEIVQEISDHVSHLRETYNMPLRISFSANKGFHILYTLPPGQKNLRAEDLPKEFILIQKSKTTFLFYTMELVALDQRSQNVLNEIKLMTNVVLYDLLMDVREHIGCLYNLCEHIAEIDVIISFAHVGSGTDYVRPKFGNELNLIESRHPILDVIHSGEVVPNDVFASKKQNFIILTGPNQSGKSIYLRQVALLQIMAQIGCYVPAKEATFTITDHLFSRITFDDNIESNASTMIVEMRDFEYITKNMTPTSLVIIDELCRGTSVEEGTILAFTLCEQILDSSALIFCATHYLLIPKLENLYYNAVNYHFEANVEEIEHGRSVLRFTHRRIPGPMEAYLYGLKAAEFISFPKDIILKATQIGDKLFGKTKVDQSANNLLVKYKLSQEFHSEIEKCDPEIDIWKIENTVRKYKEKYLKLVEKNRELSEIENTNNDFQGKSRKRVLQNVEVQSGKLILRLAYNIKKKYNKLRRRKIFYQ